MRENSFFKCKPHLLLVYIFLLLSFGYKTTILYACHFFLLVSCFSVPPSPLEPDPEPDIVVTEPKFIPLMEVCLSLCNCTVDVAIKGVLEDDQV